jgi:hypothetical protein
MDRTIPSYRIALERERWKWIPFRTRREEGQKSI